MNLQDQGMRFYVHEDGSSRWMNPELAERQNKDGGWTDMTDASEVEFMRRMTRQNPVMAQSTAERQRAFKEAQKAAGYVRLEAYVTKEQRDKFRQIGGDEWLRKKINAAKHTETK